MQAAFASPSATTRSACACCASAAKRRKLCGSNGVWCENGLSAWIVGADLANSKTQRLPRASVCACRCCAGSAATGLHPFLHTHVEARSKNSLADTSRDGTTHTCRSAHAPKGQADEPDGAALEALLEPPASSLD